MKSDILAFAAHPDDVELAACGTLIKHIVQDKTCGIIDFTEGQLGSRGTPELRLKESARASEVLGLHFRENLGMEDGWFRADKEHILKVAQVIRKYRPDVVLANAVMDRHPDHGRGADLIREAVFFSGLQKAHTGGKQLPPWRPRVVLNYIQDRFIEPDIVVDITDFMDKKMEAIMAFSSQFYNPESEEPETPISSKEFIDYLHARARQFGRYIGVEFAEGFTVSKAVGVEDLTSLL
ncbi:MAG: bacillithiol biosynthesis deacetylase BshB1 [Flavobacteriales bacterium]|nr:bacillithiol biosynthesis deacetylase BshB1 [Flavobacteriales bacterium]NNK80615.1 bacillithiol biosynthesis deacetylase BshB1 [Flavobacteriales bacterium]